MKRFISVRFFEIRKRGAAVGGVAGGIGGLIGAVANGCTDFCPPKKKKQNPYHQASVFSASFHFTEESAS